MTVLTGAPRGPIALPHDPLTGHRFRQRWEFDLLDASDRAIGTLDGVRSASMERSIHTAIRTSGTLDKRNPGEVDWHRHRIGVRYCYADESGQDQEHPLGVFLPTTPGTSYAGSGATASVDLYDKMTLLSQGQPPNTWTVDKGTSVVDAVTEVLHAVGETRIVGPDDGGGDLTNAMTWEPEATYLQIVNDVLDAGAFFSIWVDASGVWRLDPYRAPADRGVEWTHRAGEDAIFSDEFSHTADGWNVPNRVKIVGRAERDEATGEDLPAPFAVAENNDPDDPYSTVNRQVVGVTESDQDSTGEAALGSIAARRLLELSSVTSTYEIEHYWIPVDLNAAKRLIVPAHNIDALTVLQSDSWSYDAASDRGVSRVRATLREVKQ